MSRTIQQSRRTQATAPKQIPGCARNDNRCHPERSEGSAIAGFLTQVPRYHFRRDSPPRHSRWKCREEVGSENRGVRAGAPHPRIAGRHGGRGPIHPAAWEAAQPGRRDFEGLARSAADAPSPVIPNDMRRPAPPLRLQRPVPVPSLARASMAWTSAIKEASSALNSTPMRNSLPAG